MKKLPLYVIAIMVLISCSQDTPPDEITPIQVRGSVTKGNFLSGANVVFTELDDRDLAQKGSYYAATIYSSSGSYDLNIDDAEEDIARATASGYYWDEVRNQVSDGELDLVGIFEWSSELNINVLSQLESERVKYLIQNDLIDGRRSKRFGKAKKQALNEVLAVFGIDEEFERSEAFSFNSGDTRSKILLAISAALQADRDTYKVSSLLAEMTADIKEDGTLDNEDLREEIGSRLCILDIEQIAANVYQRLGDDFPGLEEDSLVSDYLDDIKAEFSGYECDPKVNPGPNAIAIGLLTEAIDENCNELTFFTDLDNDGVLDNNETVINKITICDGTDGEDGSDGEDAVSIKVATSAAADCSNGGTKFTFYLDANNNDQKDDDEVVVTETTICNGEDGSDGENGEDATPLGVQITDASAEECPAGGQKITIFSDNDADGVLDDGEEVLDFAVVCNGRSDLDFDGVPDDIDKCPESPLNDIVDENGCSFNINTQIIGKGIITSEVVVESSIERYPGGTSVRLKAEPMEGWQFKEWQGDLTGDENPIVVQNIQNNKSITAVFERQTFNVDVTIDGNGRVEQEILELPTANEYEYETVIRLTAIPDEGYVFGGWQNYYTGLETVIDIKVEESIEITALFYDGGDNDNDGILNGVDNCPDYPNPLQEDIDGDGIGDYCDVSDLIDANELTDYQRSVYQQDGRFGEVFVHITEENPYLPLGFYFNKERAYRYYPGGTFNTLDCPGSSEVFTFDWRFLKYYTSVKTLRLYNTCPFINLTLPEANGNLETLVITSFDNKGEIDVSIKDFPNLKTLELQGDITNLNLSALPNLTNIKITTSNSVSIDLDNNIGVPQNGLRLINNIYINSPGSVSMDNIISGNIDLRTLNQEKLLINAAEFESYLGPGVLDVRYTNIEKLKINNLKDVGTLRLNDELICIETDANYLIQDIIDNGVFYNGSGNSGDYFYVEREYFYNATDSYNQRYIISTESMARGGPSSIDELSSKLSLNCYD